jgi:predicted nucleotidyltransferase
LLDLVPYGGVESPRGEITWPDEARMSVLGFSDSERRCELVDVGPGLIVPIATIASLALLKLHAYRDRRQRGERKDIQDFDWYQRNYEAAGNELRVHEELGDALRLGEIDAEHAGAALLGRDVAEQHSADATIAVRAVLVEARDPWSKLITDVLAARRPTEDEVVHGQRSDACAV